MMNILLLSGERVEGVTGLVQKRFHITLQTHSVHENKRQARLGQTTLVSAGRFAFAIGKIKQLVIAHRLEAAGQFVIDVIKNIFGAGNHVIHISERLERGATHRIHAGVPRTQTIKFHLLAPLSKQFIVKRHHQCLHRFMEFKAIVRLIIKTSLRDMLELAVILKARVGRDLHTQCHQLFKLLITRIRHFETFVGDEFPRFLP